MLFLKEIMPVIIRSSGASIHQSDLSSRRSEADASDPAAAGPAREPDRVAGAESRSFVQPAPLNKTADKVKGGTPAIPLSLQVLGLYQRDKVCAQPVRPDHASLPESTRAEGLPRLDGKLPKRIETAPFARALVQGNAGSGHNSRDVFLNVTGGVSGKAAPSNADHLTDVLLSDCRPGESLAGTPDDNAFVIGGHSEIIDVATRPDGLSRADKARQMAIVMFGVTDPANDQIAFAERKLTALENAEARHLAMSLFTGEEGREALSGWIADFDPGGAARLQRMHQLMYAAAVVLKQNGRAAARLLRNYCGMSTERPDLQLKRQSYSMQRVLVSARGTSLDILGIPPSITGREHHAEQKSVYRNALAIAQYLHEKLDAAYKPDSLEDMLAAAQIVSAEALGGSGDRTEREYHFSRVVDNLGSIYQEERLSIDALACAANLISIDRDNGAKALGAVAMLSSSEQADVMDALEQAGELVRLLPLGIRRDIATVADLDKVLNANGEGPGARASVSSVDPMGQASAQKAIGKLRAALAVAPDIGNIPIGAAARAAIPMQQKIAYFKWRNGLADERKARLVFERLYKLNKYADRAIPRGKNLTGRLRRIGDDIAGAFGHRKNPVGMLEEGLLLGGFLREDVFNEKIAPAFHSLIEKYRESGAGAGAGAGVAKARSEVVSRVFEKLKIDGFSSKIEIKSDDLKKWVALAVAGGRNDAVKRSLEFESIRRDLNNGFSVDVLERWAAEAGLDDGNFRRQLNDLRSVSNNGYGEIPELGDRASVFSAFSEIVARYRAGKSLKFSSGGVGGLALGDSQSIGPLVSVSPTLGAGGGRVATVEIGGASGRGGLIAVTRANSQKLKVGASVFAGPQFIHVVRAGGSANLELVSAEQTREKGAIVRFVPRAGSLGGGEAWRGWAQDCLSIIGNSADSADLLERLAEEYVNAGEIGIGMTEKEENVISSSAAVGAGVKASSSGGDFRGGAGVSASIGVKREWRRHKAVRELDNKMGNHKFDQSSSTSVTWNAGLNASESYQLNPTPDFGTSASASAQAFSIGGTLFSVKEGTSVAIRLRDGMVDAELAILDRTRNGGRRAVDLIARDYPIWVKAMGKTDAEGEAALNRFFASELGRGVNRPLRPEVPETYVASYRMTKEAASALNHYRAQIDLEQMLGTNKSRVSELRRCYAEVIENSASWRPSSIQHYVETSSAKSVGLHSVFGVEAKKSSSTSTVQVLAHQAASEYVDPVALARHPVSVGSVQAVRDAPSDVGGRSTHGSAVKTGE
ncbi:ATP/GTP binding protein [Burkholderia pseudomallei]|nr:ATP/GTP binding protein [Burkholderia pseudomallei]